MYFFIVLSSCEYWVSQKLSFSWIPLIEALDFEVLHAYVMIRIKEVIKVQIFSSFNTIICSFAPFEIH